jgi:hypothetical protein
MQYGRRTKARNDEFEFLVVRNKAAARRKVVSEQSKVNTAICLYRVFAVT